MRLFKFVLATFAYAVFATVCYFLFLFKCGLPFEGSVACNANLEWQLAVLVACLVAAYLVASVLYWRRRAKDD